MLELARGTGELAAALVAAGSARILATDLAPAMVDAARRPGSCPASGTR